MPHSLNSDFVREQLELRAVPLEKRAPMHGDYVLYWMASTQRFEENWALRFAIIEADRLGLPLLIHHGLDPSYPYASDRVHTFVLQGARELSARARELGLTYRFALRRTRDDDRRVVDRIAARAALVVTDLYPTAGVLDRTLRFAERAACRVVMVDSVGIAPAAEFPREQSAAFQMRAKLFKGLDTHLEEVEDRAPRRMLSESALSSLDVEWLDLDRANIAAEVARCEIDHDVGPVAEVQGGLRAARARLGEFVSDGLDAYDERRREPSDDGGSSRLSRWLHFGMISAAEVVRAARASAPAPALESFLNEVVVWRELSLNFCLRRDDFMKLRAAPEWAQKSMAAHKDDERAVIYSLAQLEQGTTGSDLWNASQQELVQSGTMHNAVRQLWGKSVILWTRRYGDALRILLYLNDKYAIDGRDPNGYSGIQWCFGRFDRPFPERAIWGTIRPMSLERARSKYDTQSYIDRWLGPSSSPAQLEL
ncbi:MAG: deoxyribodipyrimidine photo-lyase [Gemmatimonadota bacterium]